MRGGRFYAMLPGLMRTRTLLLALLPLLACSSGRVSFTGEIRYAKTAEENYEAGLDEMKKENWVEAGKFYEHVRTKYPFSRFAALSELRLADAKYLQSRFPESAEAYAAFVTAHPTHEEADYAAYRAAHSRYRDAPTDFVLFPPSFEKDQKQLRAAAELLLEAALEAREGINVFSVSPGRLPDLAGRGIISPIEPYMSKEDKADYYENALQIATVNGEVYAWPQWVTAVAMFGNPDLFEERGVTPPTMEDPWTWDEFVEASRKLTFTKSDGTQVYGFSVSSAPGQELYLPVFYMDGGRVRSPDVRTFTLHQPEAVSALQKLADLHLVENVTPPDFGTMGQTDVRNQFKDGTVAMIMETPSFIAELESENLPFSVFPNPVGESGHLVTTGGFGMFGVIQVEDENAVAASHLFARYLTGLEVAEDIPGYYLAPSLRRSNTSYATDARREIISRLVAYGIYEPPTQISDEVSQLLGKALQSILLGEKTAQEALNEIAPLYQKELDSKR